MEKNDNEIFIGGDPRFLAGALPHASAALYDRRPVTIRDPKMASTTRSIGFAKVAKRGAREALERAGVWVRRGKMGYHHRPNLNVFLREGEWPSAGVELETEERPDVMRDSLEAALVSNWFHFENDGSLGTTGDDGISRDGYELITEPLPPRFYRNPRLWAGLQNIVSPWLESWKFRETGLHVHVGLTQFEEARELAFLHSAPDRRTFAKFLIAYMYFAICDRTFSDRVFLRRSGGYCDAPNDRDALFTWKAGMTGADVVDGLMSSIAHAAYWNNWLSSADEYVRKCREMASSAARKPTSEKAAAAIGMDATGLKPEFRYFLGISSAFSGHHVELNMGNSQTIEFRRGKGTVNGVSIHRMVEFATILARYAMHVLRSPDEEVSPERLYAYIAENTTSGALRTLVEQHLKGE